MIMTYRQFKDYFFKQLHAMYDENELNVIYREFLKQFCGIEPVHQLLISDSDIHHLIFPVLQSAAQRLSTGEPYQYICGSAEFFDLKLWVNKYVLIPRPETEELIRQVILEYGNTKRRPSSILDLCTGSGCIALALKKQFPEAHVVATDYSPRALKTAEYNSYVHQLPVELIKNDLLSEELPFSYLFDCIVSNPPYVTKEDKTLMDRRVLDFEPSEALFAPETDHLAFYRILKDIVIRVLSPGGFFTFEINESFGEDCASLFRDFHDEFECIKLQKDSFGKYRFVSGMKRNV
jgi:release factor glutamine methyltransferase